MIARGEDDRSLRLSPTEGEGEVKRLRGGRDETETKKTTFANVVIAVCVAVAVLVTGCVIYEYHRLDTVMPPGVISALFAFWGGELLIVALRQIFGSDVVTKSKKDTEGSI